MALFEQSMERMPAFPSNSSISIFVCYGRSEEVATSGTSEFLLRTSKRSDLDVTDLFYPKGSEGLNSSFSFSKFIQIASSIAEFESILLIRSTFRISLESVRLLQQAHAASGAHISTPRVAGTRNFPFLCSRYRRLDRKPPTEIIGFGMAPIECFRIKYGRCEAILFMKGDVSMIMEDASFSIETSNKCYVRSNEKCKVQAVIDSVVF